MGIFSRLTDIINANINSLLEKAEDPEKIIRLMIQEMEDTLVEIRSSAAKCIADKKEHQRHIARMEAQLADWEMKAELALNKDREDLARAALREKAEIADFLEVLNEELAVIESQLKKFNDDIGQLQSKLNDAKARQRSLVMRHTSATSQLKTRRHIHDEQLDEMLFRFENAERKIDSMESEAEAMDMGRRRSLADEIGGLENDDRVEDALEELKSRMKAQSKTGSKAKKESK